MKKKFSRKEQYALVKEGRKGCSRCGDVLPLKYFQKMNTKLGYRSDCKYCRHMNDRKKDARVFLSKDDFYHRLDCETSRGERDYVKKIQRIYNISFNEALELSNRAECEICGAKQSDSTRRFAVDHCHSTDKVRGVLCDPCNKGLGCFKDNTDALKRAIEYLNKGD